MTSLRICFCNSNQAWGGGEHWHLGFARLMRERGHRPHILAALGSVLLQRAKEAGLPVTGMRLGRLSFCDPLAMAALRRHFHRTPCDVLLPGLPQDVKAAGIAARLAGVRVVIYRRGMGLPVRDSFFNRFLYRRVLSGVIVNSLDTARALLAENPHLLPRERIHLLPNGLEPELLTPPPPCDGGHPVVIGTAGRLVEQKGQRLLIQAAGILRDQGLDFEVRIAGEGPLQTELQTLVRDLELDARVSFLGFVQEMRSFLQACHIFAFPSLWEGMGRAPLEAMAAGRPVVGFDVSSMSEVVEHRQTGLLVPTGDVEALAASLRTLILNPEVRARMGVAGYDRACKEFSLKTIVPRFESILDAYCTAVQGIRGARGV